MTEHPTNRDAVRNLQRYLRRLSYEDNGILPIPVDGCGVKAEAYG